MNVAIPEISAATRLLITRLSKAAVGETVSYTDLSAFAHIDVLTHRGPLTSARRIVHRQNNILFAAVIGIGIKRLDDAGVANDVSRDFGRVHRAARRGVKKAEAVQNFAALPSEQRTRFLATTSCLGAIAEATRESTIKRLSGPVEKAQARLPLAETLEAFKHG